ncbi:hypothetical protein Dimus_038228 [Dionaea muscipula]
MSRERVGKVFRVERPSRFTKGQSRKFANKSKGGEDWRAERRASPEGRSEGQGRRASPKGRVLRPRSGGQGPESRVRMAGSGGQGRRARLPSKVGGQGSLARPEGKAP